MSQALLSGYRGRAMRLLRDPRSVALMLNEAEQMVQRPGHLTGRLAELHDTVSVLVDMVRARLAGHYRRLSTRSLALIAAGLVYLVVPTDTVPDVVPVVGLLDDVTVLGWIGSAVAREIEQYQSWLAE